MNTDLSSLDKGASADDASMKISENPDLIENMYKEGYLSKLNTANGLSYRIEKDIYARITDNNGRETRGPKIISEGGIIDSQTFSDIIKRRLWERIDKCMSIDGQLNQETIVSSVQRLKEDSSIHRIIFETGKAELIEEIIKKIDFDKIMLENLNLLYEQEHECRYVQHAQNTAIFAIKIGTGYGLSKAVLIDLAKSGYLHDIGKVAIDPVILKKHEDELTDAEKRQLTAHPLIGEYILEGSTSILNKKYDMIIKRGIGDHHERPGSEGGYPRGIRGDKIGDFARIIAIASRFDNMLSTSIKGTKKSEDAFDEANVITEILDWLKKMADTGWYDPIYTDILAGFFIPLIATGIGKRESKDEIRTIYNIFTGIEKAVRFMMNLKYDNVKSPHPRASDYCRRIYRNAFQIDQVIRETGLSEPLLLTYSQDSDATNDVKKSMKKTVSVLNTPLRQIHESLEKFGVFAEERGDTYDFIIDSFSTWYDVIDKTLKNTTVH